MAARFTSSRLGAAWLAFVFLTATVSAQQPPAPRAELAPRIVPVVWLIGQSNAEGTSNGFWLTNPIGPGAPYARLASQPGVQIWWPGPSPMRPSSVPAWEPYRVGSFLPVNNGSWYVGEGVFGPEASIGEAAVARFGEVYVFKATCIAPLDPRAPVTFSKRASGGVTVYPIFQSAWMMAVTELAARGLQPEIQGIIWVQGEADCFAPGQPDRLTYARAYAANLTRFITDLRQDLAPNRLPIPFVISQLHDRHLPRTNWAPSETLVRQAQASAAATLPAVTVTPTQNISVEPSVNQLHYDAPGTIALGGALFRGLETLLR